jgi:hypothetical protein
MMCSISWILVETHKTSEVASLAHLLVDLAWDNLGFVPFCNIRLDLVVYPLADFVTESGMG